MIKRLLWLVVALVCVARSVSAQQGLQGYVVAGTGAQARIVLTGSAIVFHQLTWNVTGTVSSCTVALDTSADGVSWSAGNAIAGQTCTSNGQSALSTSAVFNFVRVNTTAFSGTGSVVITWAGYVATPGGLPSGCTSPGTGAITCAGTVAANALTSTTSVSTGSGASAAGAAATGGFAAVEAASTGWTPTAGQDYCRADSTVHNFVCALNGGPELSLAEGPSPATTNGVVFYDGTKLSTDTGLLYNSSVPGLFNNANHSPGLVWPSSGNGNAYISTEGLDTFDITLPTNSAHGLGLIVNNLFGTNDTRMGLFTTASGWNILEGNGGLGIVLSMVGSNPISIRPNRVETARFPSGGGIVNLEGAAPTNIASSTAVYEDSTRHEEFAATAGASTFGMKVRVQPGKIHQTAQTAAIPTATLCAAAAGACNVAGNYTVEWAFTQVGTACGTPGAGGVTFLLTWTDQNGVAHSAIQMPMDDAASLVATTGTFHFTTSNATAWGSGNMNISSNGSILQYATGYTACGVGTGSYQLDAWVTAKE